MNLQKAEKKAGIIMLELNAKFQYNVEHLNKKKQEKKRSGVEIILFIDVMLYELKSYTLFF